jgi:ethanolamine ammonia-lyase large subunit
MHSATVAGNRYTFPDIAALLAKAPPLRSGDVLAGIAAANDEERVAAQVALADLPLCRYCSRGTSWPTRLTKSRD